MTARRQGETTGAARLLVVDDAPPTLEVLQRNLSAAGYHVLTALGVAEAIRLLESEPVDLVITDLKMPGASGLELVRHVRENFRHTEIMIITGYPSVESAVQAVKIGAEEYLSKPFTDEELLAAVARVLHKLNERSSRAPAQRARLSPYGLVGESPGMLAVFEGIAAAASAEGPVLVEGESGTGKEVVARAIHDQARTPGPFLSIRCDGLPEEHLENELFGPRRRSKGAFAGMLAVAEGGTVYLAAIGEAGPRVQERLSSYRTAHRRGPRLILSSEDELATLVSQGLFLQSLFVQPQPPISVPPLRQRGHDLSLLCEHFAARFAAEWQREPIRFQEAAVEALRGYAWPGNVRELRALVRRLSAEPRSGPVQVVDLPAHLRFRFAGRRDLGADRTLEEVEAEHIRNVVTAVDGNKARAAEVLAIDRKTLREKLRRYGLA